MHIRKIQINNKTAQGIKIKLPNANLVIVAARKGYIMCGYLDTRASEKFRDCAAVVKGVKSVNDVLSKKISKVTTGARKLGIRVGMKGSEALKKML